MSAHSKSKLTELAHGTETREGGTDSETGKALLGDGGLYSSEQGVQEVGCCQWHSRQ